MKLETKTAVIAGAAMFAVLATCQVDSVITFFATAIAGVIGWYIGCSLSPDEPVKGEGFTRRCRPADEFKDTSHRNYEDF